MAQIRVTPEELSQQGNNLKGYAEELKDILGKIDSEIQTIDAGWDGLAQDAYIDMYSNMKQSLEQFPEIVNSLGDATISAADAFEQVDDGLQQGFKGAQ